MLTLSEQLVQKYSFLSGIPPILVYFALLFISAVAIFVFISLTVLFLTYFERKIGAHIQDRLGPMLAGGWHGWAQALADTVKLLLKEDIIPKAVDKKLFIVAPFIVFIGLLICFVVLPFGEKLFVTDLNIGIFYILAASSIIVVGIIMAGWSSNNKWSLLGAMRSAAQIVSYEVPVGLALLTAIMVVGSLGMQEIVRFQAGGFWNWIVFRNPFTFIAFLLYFIASLAETNRSPFDIPEAESELVAGYHTEYSGMRFAFFFLEEYGNIFLVSAVASTVFLGGWQGLIGEEAFIPAPLIFIVKSIILIFVIIWLRWTLPRLRVDQLMYLSWKVLIPFGFTCVIGTGIWMLLGMVGRAIILILLLAGVVIGAWTTITEAKKDLREGKIRSLIT